MRKKRTEGGEGGQAKRAGQTGETPHVVPVSAQAGRSTSLSTETRTSGPCNGTGRAAGGQPPPLVLQPGLRFPAGLR